MTGVSKPGGWLVAMAILSGMQATSRADTTQAVPLPPSVSPGTSDAVKSDADARGAAEQILRHIYAVYLSLRTCSNLAVEAGRAGYAPTVTLEEARRALQAIDGAAKSAGIDTSRTWSDIAPIGLVTAEALRPDTPDHLSKCHIIGGVFHTDEANLQVILGRLGWPVDVIRKDY